MDDQNSVLIVDDDDEIRHALRLLFEFEDFIVVGEARHGVEAIPLALRLQPSFVVLDYMMPHMDGAKTAEVLRRIVPDARIVAFSAVLETQPQWADAYLNKDRITEIAPLIRTLINSALPRAKLP